MSHNDLISQGYELLNLNYNLICRVRQMIDRPARNPLVVVFKWRLKRHLKKLLLERERLLEKIDWLEKHPF